MSVATTTSTTAAVTVSSSSPAAPPPYYYHFYSTFSTAEHLSTESGGPLTAFQWSPVPSSSAAWSISGRTRRPLADQLPGPQLCSYAIAPAQSIHRHEFVRSIASLAPPLGSHPRFKNFSIKAMDLNGDAGAKRKRSSIVPAERPAKHLKPESSALTPGDSTPANGTVYDIEDEDDASRLLPIGPAQADSPEWQATIEEVVKSVVSIHFCQTCSFDTELSMSSQATGFVVDAERGYILTNRHVVCPGPFWGYCIFDNHEEVSLAIELTLGEAVWRGISP